ncbi:MAG TPA: formimidoylglutamate deiminase [Candidatus Baltobacteraceae bacterium]|nr:formimidoylglutamate deiminase [Candidatus Baltobacteraceae bacterium]
MRIHARQALLPEGWAPDVAIDIAPDGTIVAVAPGTRRAPDDDAVDGALLPGMPNVHSHAFQRAMAGSAERRGPGDDDFWSWREAMYALAASLQPDDLKALATSVYRKMLRAGYTAVAEFHYLHRDPSGRWYADKAVMARALVEAAREAGLAVCLLPALYAHADVGGAPLADRQKRFATTVDDVLAIADELRAAYANDPSVVVGACAHSLRAVTPAELRALVEGSPPDVPVHLHVAEQLREVRSVEATLGARPVAWLLANHDVDRRWCLVHATQVDDSERDALARSGAVVGLCPTTEANLGDGVFPLAPYLRANGAFSIGSDSNVSIAPAEELRWLEYGQRLATGRRIVAARRAGESCGQTLYASAASAGARACGFATGAIAPGCRADFVVIAPEEAEGDLPRTADDTPETMLDRYVFASSDARPERVYVRGRVIR